MNPVYYARELINRARKVAGGICIQCGDEKESGREAMRCRPCQQHNHNRRMERLHALPPRNDGKYACGICGQKGHNSRRCKLRDE